MRRLSRRELVAAGAALLAAPAIIRPAQAHSPQQRRAVLSSRAALLPLDLVTGAAAAFSTRKLRTAYSGSALRLRESSGNTEQDIGFDAAGNLDTAAATAFLNGASGFVTKWYDQTGNGRHLLNATAASQFAYSASVSNSRPGITSDGARFLQSASGAFPGAQAEVTYSVVGAVLSQPGANARLIASWKAGGTDFGTGSSWLVSGDATTNWTGLTVGGAKGGSTDLLGSVAYGTYHSMLMEYTTTGARATIDGTLTSATLTTASATVDTDNLILGASFQGAANSPPGFAEMIVFHGSILSASDKSALAASQKTYFGTP